MKSVFVINGFLDSGKTQFMSYTLAQPYFRTQGTTLLIVCEEGEEEYDEKLLKATNTVMVVVDDPSDITPDKLMEMDKTYKPSRVLIEYNGMWNYKEFRLPFLWKLEQQITLIDASTFEMYFANMKSLLVEQLRKSELIIFNRCDNLYDKLPGFKRSIRTICQNAEIAFEDKDGEVNATLEEELPYDVSADEIVLTDDTYVTWFADVHDNLERYEGKKITFLANAVVPPRIKGIFVPGRAFMNCCAQDIQFLGLPCKYDGKVADKSWVNVTVTVHNEYFDGYKGEGPVLHAVSVTPAKAPKKEVLQ